MMCSLHFLASGRSGRPVVVDFSAAWCGDCKAMAPKLQKIRQEMAGKDVEFITLDVSFAGPGLLVLSFS